MGRPATDPEVRFWAKVNKTEDCWEWAAGVGIGRRGPYGRFRLPDRTVYAHRFSWELHFGEVPPDQIVCHTCDNPRCVRPDHLFLGDHKINSDDKFKKGRQRFLAGEEQPTSKVSDEDVKFIRAAAAEGMGRSVLASKFGISTAQVGRIINYKSRKEYKLEV